MAIRTISVIAILILVLVGIVTIGYAASSRIVCEGQPVNNNEVPTAEQQIFGDRIIGQTFVAPRDHLNEIGLMFQTYGRRNEHEVTLRLLEIPANTANPFSGIERFTVTFDASTLQDKSWRSFVIPEIPDSAGKTYLITLESPQSVPGNAITVGGIERDLYLPGIAYLGPVPVQADFAFKSCYRMSLVEKAQTLAQQMTNERPGLWGNPAFYGLTMTLYAAVVVLLFILMARLARVGSE